MIRRLGGSGFLFSPEAPPRQYALPAAGNGDRQQAPSLRRHPPRRAKACYRRRDKADPERYPQLCQYSGRHIPWRLGLASLPRQDRRLLQICFVGEVKTPLAALQTSNAQGLWGGGGRITEQCSSLQTRTPSSLPPMANGTDIHFLRVFPGTKSRRLFTGI